MSARVHRKLTPPKREIVKNSTAALDGRHNLTEGKEATVKFPGRKTRLRARFLYADDSGNLVFVDPRTGGLRTVTPDAVHAVHRDRKLRS